MNEIINRPQFLVDLLAEVDAFDAELFKPKDPVSAENEDKVIGELSPWCRKVYSYMRYLNRQGHMLTAEREYNSVQEVTGDAEVCELRYKSNLLNELLYTVVRSELRAFAAECIGVREGWKVVTTSPDDDADPIKSMILGAIRRMKKG
jgi:hypothetical protein